MEGQFSGDLPDLRNVDMHDLVNQIDDARSTYNALQSQYEDLTIRLRHANEEEQKKDRQKLLEDLKKQA